jgi:C1A family cysteine protease
MKAIVLIALLFASTLAESQVDLRPMFESWKVKYGKSYVDWTEEEYRFGVFQSWFSYNQGWNAASNSAKLGLNKFSDLTSEEFKALYTGTFAENDVEFFNCKTPATAGAKEWNWATNTSIVTPIKNQGQCGSCWAFASVAVSESLYALNGNPLTSFSEQQVVDCDTLINHGCNGGIPKYALDYISLKGLETETEYPYDAANGKCQYQASEATKTGVTGACAVEAHSVQALENAVYQQPTVVIVEADQAAWQQYTGGVVSNNCGVALDHAVTATGFTDTYFIIKNSWGSDWGEEGYIWISNDASANNGAGVCGILSQPVFPSGLNA